MVVSAFASSFVPGSIAVKNRVPLCSRSPTRSPTRSPYNVFVVEARALPSGPVGIGIIGAGRIGQVHARTISSLPGAKLVAVADPFEEPGRAVATKFNTIWEADWKALLDNDEIKGVVIGSPTPYHAEQLIRCAEAGKDIFCEKPISNDLSTIDRCLQTISANEVRLLVGFQRRFDTNFVKMHDQIRMGTIGSVRTFSITSRDPAPPPADYLAKSGGIFLDMASHDFDMARYLTGAEIDEVYVAGAAFEDAAKQAGDLDTVITMLRMSDGSFGTITNSRRCAYGYDQRIEIFGSDGALFANNKKPDSVVINTGAGSATGLPHSFFMDRYKEAYEGAMIAFVDMICSGSPSPVSGLDGRAPIVAGMAAAKSAKEGMPVKCSSVDLVHV